MTTSIITASYNNSITVNFTNDAWFNATEVAKQYNKRPNDWLNLEGTKEYVLGLHRVLFPNSPLPVKMVAKENQLVRTVNGGKRGEFGSWFHPKLAVAFARWLSVDFSIWCDMQIEKILQDKPVQRDFVNEPFKIPFATKEQREPLVKAVRRLVAVASEKGKAISYENAHSIINLKMGVSSVEELTLEQIPQAMSLVGDILERVVLEGEYIAKGEAEQAAKIIEPEIVSEPMPYRDREALIKIIHSLSGRFRNKQVWSTAISFRLRQATGRKSPAHFHDSDKPIMVKEFEPIFTIVRKVEDMIRKIELESARRLVRKDEEFDKVIAEFEVETQALFAALEGDVKVLLNTVDRYEIKQFAA
jgi:hypothetical protein